EIKSNYGLGFGCTIPLIIGIIANLFVLFVLRSVTIRSTLTTWLLRVQTILDALCCFWDMIFIWVRQCPYSSVLGGWFQCHLWRTQIPYWLAEFMSTCNLAWIMLDRLWATVYCVTYRLNETKYLIATSIGTVVLSVGALIPNVLIVEFVNMTCVTHVNSKEQIAYHVSMFYQPFDFIVYYALPIIVMLFCHFRVVCYYRSVECEQLRHREQEQQHREQEEQQHTEQDKCHTSVVFVDPLYRSMTVGSFCMICCLIIGHTFDVINYLLSNIAKNYLYDFGSDVQLIGTFVTTLNSIVNPVINIFAVPAVKYMKRRHISFINRKFKGLN
ncbi:hypothetical protein FBUS_03070, partial [Fasciolopsis buskii]